MAPVIGPHSRVRKHPIDAPPPRHGRAGGSAGYSLPSVQVRSTVPECRLCPDAVGPAHSFIGAYTWSGDAPVADCWVGRAQRQNPRTVRYSFVIHSLVERGYQRSRHPVGPAALERRTSPSRSPSATAITDVSLWTSRPAHLFTVLHVLVSVFGCFVGCSHFSHNPADRLRLTPR